MTTPLEGPPPLVQQLGSAVLLQGPAVRDAAYLVAAGIKALRRNSCIEPPRRWLDLSRCLHTAAHPSDIGSPEVPDDDEAAVLPAEVLTTSEAAALLGVTERQMRNLAPRLGAIRPGRAHLFDRLAVEAEADRRNEERSGSGSAA